MTPPDRQPADAAADVVRRVARRDLLKRAGWASLGTLAAGGLGLGGSHVLTHADTRRTVGDYRVGAPRRFSYRSRTARDWSPRNVGDLYLPEGASGPLPVLMLIHGGGWSDDVTFQSFDAISRGLCSHGIAVWNIEYRGKQSDDGYRGTLRDVADAADYLVALARRPDADLDLDRFFVSGHSAGGQLAGWTLSRHRFRAGQVGAHPPLRPRGGIILSGPMDLKRAAERGDHNATSWLGKPPNKAPARYREASPQSYLPLGIPVTCVHGRNDTVVLPEQSVRYVRRARELGDPARYVSVLGDHGITAHYGTPQWARVRKLFLEMILGED